MGAGAGDQRSGPGAILAFDFAFYVQRDAAAVRAVAPNAVAREDVLQRAINTTPPGTTHCLRIAERGKDQYSVELSLYKPDGTVWKVYSQVVTTAYRDGRFWVGRVRSAS